MAGIGTILGAAGILVAGFVARDTAGHRRMAPDLPGNIREMPGPARPGVPPAPRFFGVFRASEPAPRFLMGPLPRTRTLHGMSTRWRIGLAAIVAVVVIGGFVPHGVLSEAGSSVTQMAQVAEVPVSGPATCLDATCGKGSPAPAAPTPGISLVAVVGGLMAVAASAALVRRQRGRVLTLPAGARDPLYHPPQFS